MSLFQSCQNYDLKVGRKEKESPLIKWQIVASQRKEDEETRLAP